MYNLKDDSGRYRVFPHGEGGGRGKRPEYEGSEGVCEGRSLSENDTLIGLWRRTGWCVLPFEGALFPSLQRSG